MLRTRCPAASSAVVARLRISTGGACSTIAVMPCSRTAGQNRLAENLATVSASAPAVSAPTMP